MMPLMPFEAANIVRRMAAYGELDASTAAEVVADLQALPVDLAPFGPLADRIWALAGRPHRLRRRLRRSG
jgi:hypothetical protein